MGLSTHIFYHGSCSDDVTPTFGLGDDHHDYGRGFYTTADKELGKKCMSLCTILRGIR